MQSCFFIFFMLLTICLSILAAVCYSASDASTGEIAYRTDGNGTFFLNHFTTIGRPLEEINVFEELEKSENEFLYLQSSDKVRELMTDLPEDTGVINRKDLAGVNNTESEDRFDNYIRSQLTKSKVNGYQIRDRQGRYKSITYFNSDPSPELALTEPPLNFFHTDGNRIMFSNVTL
jgi:hypothetical protein